VLKLRRAAHVHTGDGTHTSKLKSATSPQDVLSVFTANLHDLNHIHVSTAFNMLGKMAKQPDFSPQNIMADDGFKVLLRLTRDFAENRKLDAQAVANATHGIAKLHEAGRLGGSVDDALAALAIDAVRLALEMNSMDVANTLYAYSVLYSIVQETVFALASPRKCLSRGCT
jgi:hypothetical protein